MSPPHGHAVGVPVLLPLKGALVEITADGELGTAGKDAVSHNVQGGGNDDVLQILAILEALVTKGLHTLGDDDLGQGGASVKGLLAQ
jgi:hypothetical protein